MNRSLKVLLVFTSSMVASLAYAGAEKDNSCPFTLGQLCFQPAVGVVYSKSPVEDDYRDIRFAAVLHEKVSNEKKHSWGVMVTPGENFIDAAGFGGAYAFIEIEENKFAVLNYGLLAKKFTNPNDVRGGAYLLLSYGFK